MAPLLIAQVSDLHIRNAADPLLGYINTRTKFSNCITHILKLDPRPDVVLVTGDLDDRGDPKGYAWIRAQLRRLPMLSYVIAGNHDDRPALHAAFLEEGYLPEESAFLHYSVDGFPLRLLALDTLFPGDVGGGLCVTRLRWLEERLKEQPDRPTLILMHHPPFPTGIGFIDQPPFQGASEFEHLVRQHPQIRQIVCGHVHRAGSTGFGGTIATIAPSAAYQMDLDLRTEARFRPTTDPSAIALHYIDNDLRPVSYVSFVH